MDMTPEELAAEQAAAQVPKEEEIRANIITEYGFDEVADVEKIDKAVAKELDHKTKLSQAIGQKIKHRTEADELRKKVPPPAAPTPKEDIAKTAEEIVAKTLEQRDLDDMEVSDVIKAEIKRVAQNTGKSVKAIKKDPYIVALIEADERATKTEEAAISKTNRSSGKKNYTMDNPPEIDTSTPEAFKKTSEDYEEWKRAMVKDGN